MIFPDITAHTEAFEVYVKPFTADASSMLLLKVKHTAAVVAAVRAIIDGNKDDFSPLTARAALIAAQYHDIGRFMQYRDWHTFKDALSVNHARLGCTVLRREHVLDCEPPSVSRLVRIAVCLHNRRVLPGTLNPDERVVADAVRDADKADIFRMMAGMLSGTSVPEELELSVKNDPMAWSEKVAEDVCRGCVPSYTDLKYVNDFRMVLVCWLKDLRFESVKRSLIEAGYPRMIFRGLPDADGLRPALRVLHALVEPSC